VHSWFYKQLLL